ncbi:MAG TPA: TlyA family RNA methyltransferase [Candidatus Saccharimonadales bacterium]|nr:TlyA family RNA methyltransferase [Candidatus Saccharimonadales bacterium]
MTNSTKQRLDKELMRRGLAATRSQAEDDIRRGFIKVNGTVVTKPGFLVSEAADIAQAMHQRFVSRAGEKLFSVLKPLSIDFRGKTVLDVGSSTGGFTDVALQQGAKKVIAVDVGTDQLHPSLAGNPRIKLHEKTDIRDFKPTEQVEVVVADVSFISLRDILPHVARLVGRDTAIVAMVKPQFEAGQSSLKHKGVIKNDKMRRDILKDFETWARQQFVIINKADSAVAGSKGNLERFYLLRKSDK